MDPVTAALNLATKITEFGEKIWDAAPVELKTQNAADWMKFTHNIGAFITSVQDKINAVAVKP